MEIFHVITILTTILLQGSLGQDVIKGTLPLDNQPLFIENNGAEGYKFSFSTKDQSREEEGRFIDGIWTVRGRVSWISDDGDLHTQEYMADDNGYRLLTGEPMELPPLVASPGILRGLSPGALASLAG